MNEKHLIFLGDVHADISGLINEINRIELSDCTIVQLGDFGMGFEPLFHKSYTMIEFDKFLKLKNIDLLIIRGNHDNPYFWNTSLINPPYENILLVPDFTVLTLGTKQKSYLFVGGGISIDRHYRKEDISYWKSELINYDFIDSMSKMSVDCLITHVPPFDARPTRNNISLDSLLIQDLSLKKDLKKESDYIDKLIFKTSPKIIISGHWHSNYNTTIYKKNREINSYILNTMQFMSEDIID